MKTEAFDFNRLAENWKSPLVARSEIDTFTGGLLSHRTMANIDSRGIGPQKIKIGRKVGYPVDSLVAWLQERANERA